MQKIFVIIVVFNAILIIFFRIYSFTFLVYLIQCRIYQHWCLALRQHKIQMMLSTTMMIVRRHSQTMIMLTLSIPLIKVKKIELQILFQISFFLKIKFCCCRFTSNSQIIDYSRIWMKLTDSNINHRLTRWIRDSIGQPTTWTPA